MINKIPETSFVRWLEGRDLSERTIKEYKYYLGKLNKLGKLNQENTDKLIRKLNNNVCRALLKNVKTYLLRNKSEFKLTDSERVNIAAIEIQKKVRSERRKIPETISITEVEDIYKEFKKDVYKIMLILTYRCALRISELFNISSNDFNFTLWKKNRAKNGMLKVEGKGKRKDTILVKPHVMKMVEAFINNSYDPKKFNPEIPLFQAIKPHVWRHALRATGKKAIDKKVNPHMLRHSYATYLLEQGWDIRRIQVFLRHSDITSTQIYAQVSKKQLSEDYEGIE